MEFSFEFNINGEILIPLEDTFNNHIISKGNDDSIQAIPLNLYLSQSYRQFRAVLYQNEVMRVIIAIQLTKIRGEEEGTEDKVEDFIKDILIQIEFSIDFNSNCNASDMITNSSIVKSNEKVITEAKPSFTKATETITRRYVDEKKKIALIEVVKQVQVPSCFLNNAILLKVSLVKKTNVSFLSQIPITDINTFKTTEEFTLVKTLFKEVKVIKPLLISQPKQLDCTPDISLFQIKLENISSSINMIDLSLQKSQLLNGQGEDITEIVQGVNVIIREIQVLKDETLIESKMVLNLNKKEQYIQREAISLQLDSLCFVVCNRNNFPLTIHPGEDYNLMIKLFKENVFHDKLITANNTTTRQENSNQSKSSFKNSVLKDAITKKTATASKDNTLNSFTELKNGTQSAICLTEGKGKHLGSNSTTKSKSSKRNSKASNELNEEIIKYVMSTPIFLSIDTDNGYYDNMSISILMKWKNEYKSTLQVSMSIEGNSPLTLCDYFSVRFQLKNSSQSEMNLLMRFSKSFEQIQVNKRDINKEFFETSDDVVESEGIVSEMQEKDLGVIQPKQTEEVVLRFLPLKTGYHSLPSIDIIDKHESNAMKYFVYHMHKIYIQEASD